MRTRVDMKYHETYESPTLPELSLNEMPGYYMRVLDTSFF
jgi:hypothetical protein